MSLAQILSQNLRGAKVPRRFQPLLNQAGAEALVRYGGQYDQLNQLREQSALQMRQAQAQATSAAQLEAALAGQAQHNLNANTNPLVARLAAYDNAPANSSAAVVAQNLGLTHDATNALLSQAAVNAPIRASQQGQQASVAHLQDLQRINAQRASLLGEAGNYITGRTQDLITGDRKQRSQLNKTLRDTRTRLATAGVTSSGQIIKGGPKDPSLDPSKQKTAAELDYFNKHGYFPPTGPPKSGTGKLPGGVKLNTPVQHGALKDKVSSALADVQKQKGLGRSRREIASLLISGRPAQTITLSPGDPGYDPSNPAKNKISAPAVKKHGQLALSVALDQAFNQHVSGHNVNELHRRGYSVKTLGFDTTPPRRRTRRTPSKRVVGSYGPAGPVNS